MNKETMDSSRLEYLFERYIQQTANLQEEQEFLQLAELPENKEALQTLLEGFVQATQPENKPSLLAEEAILQAIFLARPKVVPLHRQPSFRWAVAAVLLLAIGSMWFMVTGKRSADGVQNTVAAKTQDVPAPKETRAVIILADGSKLYLDSANKGTIAQQDNVNVVKSSNEEIEYQLKTNNQRQLAYNTLVNPRGSKTISLTLSDGTKVWLNSESSLRYPTVFNGHTRDVEITGEAYFEVAHNARQPFHVKKGNVDVAVLGTHFNVNAYEDDEALRVTLLEGSVKVRTVIASSAKNASNAVVIKPGQQAILRHAQDDITIDPSADIEQVMAWKNGLFQFNNADIKTVMRQLARWYDIDVVYEGSIPVRKFEGKIQRDLSLADVLEPLAKNRVHFKIEGKRITIMP